MDFKLPELGEGVHEGELVKWRVAVGETVKDDQPLVEIMTDKATVELPSPFAGKITGLSAKEGEMVHVGQTLLTYEGSGASAAKSAPVAAAPAPAAPKTPSAPATMSMAPSSVPAASVGDLSVDRRVLAAPSTRRAAREMGVDLSRIQGSGPHGRVLREDLSQSRGAGAVSAGHSMPARAPMHPSGGEERVAFKGLRKKISEKMRLSKDHAAHFTYVEEADATQLVALRAQLKEQGAAQGVKVTYLPLIMKMMVQALRKYPILNSSLDEEKGELVYKHFFNIGLSVQTEDGLTAPVIKNVEQKSVMQLAREIQDVVDRARKKKLTMEDLSGGTITLTNAGSIGGLFATPIINYPEVAILGFNKIFRKPVALTTNGREEITVRDWTYFSISLDHRVVDGAIAAEFMKEFIKIVENPVLLFSDQF
jgi:pyruvate dehydrogenase E2 component (dihydrolipoamide acetyltransferase)